MQYHFLSVNAVQNCWAIEFDWGSQSLKEYRVSLVSSWKLRRRTLYALCTCADFAGEIEHATLLHKSLPVSWFHWCEKSLPSTTLSGEEVMKALTPLHLQNYAPSCLFQENTVVMHFKVRVVTGVIIQLIFPQQYFPIPVPCNITQYCMGVIARALGLRGILATTMCFN